MAINLLDAFKISAKTGQNPLQILVDANKKTKAPPKIVNYVPAPTAINVTTGQPFRQDVATANQKVTNTAATATKTGNQVDTKPKATTAIQQLLLKPNTLLEQLKNFNKSVSTVTPTEETKPGMSGSKLIARDGELYLVDQAGDIFQTGEANKNVLVGNVDIPSGTSYQVQGIPLYSGRIGRIKFIQENIGAKQQYIRDIVTSDLPASEKAKEIRDVFRSRSDQPIIPPVATMIKQGGLVTETKTTDDKGVTTVTMNVTPSKNVSKEYQKDVFMYNRIQYQKTGEVPSEYQVQLEGQIPSEYQTEFTAHPELKKMWSEAGYEKFLGFNTTKKTDKLNEMYSRYVQDKIKTEVVTLSPAEEIKKDYESQSEPVRVVRNVIASFLSAPQRMVEAITTDVTNLLHGGTTGEGATMLAEGGLQHDKLNTPSVQVAEWEYGIKQESNPLMKWIKVQIPTYEYIILPVVGGAAFKLIEAAEVGAVGTWAGTTITTTKNITQYALIPAAMGLELGTVAAETGPTSKETVGSVFTNIYMLGVGVTAYRMTDVAGFNAWETNVKSKINVGYGKMKEVIPEVFKQPVVDVRTTVGTFKSESIAFKSTFYNMAEANYRLKYGQDSFGNKPTLWEKTSYTLTKNITKIKKPFSSENILDTKSSMTSFGEQFQKGSRMKELSFDTRPEIIKEYVESGFRMTETKYGELFVQKIGVTKNEDLGLAIKKMTGQNIFNEMKLSPGSEPYYKGMEYWGMPSEPMVIRKGTAQVNFFGEAVFENQRVNISEGFSKIRSQMETNILESKISDMARTKGLSESYKLYNKNDWYTYGKEIIKTETKSLDVTILNKNKITFKQQPYKYYSMEDWGLPSESMGKGVKQKGSWEDWWNLTDKDVLKHRVDINKVSSNERYSDALSKMGKINKSDTEGMKLNKSYDITKYGMGTEKPLVQQQLDIKTFRPTIFFKGESTSLRFYSGVEKLGLPSVDMGISIEKPVKTSDLFSLLEKPYTNVKETPVAKKPVLEWTTQYQTAKVPTKYIRNIEFGIINTSHYWDTSKPSQDRLSSSGYRLSDKNVQGVLTNKNIMGEIDTSLLGMNQLSNQSIGIRQASADLSGILDIQGSADIQSPMELQGQLSQQAQLQAQDLKLDLDYKLDYDMKYDFTTKTPTIIIPPFLNWGDDELRKKRKKKTGIGLGRGFNVFVKTRHYYKGKKIGEGVFQKVNIQPLSEQAALSLLGTKLKMTAAATGKLVPTGAQVVSERESNFSWDTIASQFYTKGEGVYVQKKQFRMGTKREHKEITGMRMPSGKKMSLSFGKRGKGLKI